MQFKKICRLFFAAILLFSTLAFSTSTSRAETTYYPRPASTLHWHACPNKIHLSKECAVLTVPLDYAHPTNGSIKIGISRIKATNEKQRIGVLFLNAGGPGETGIYGLNLVDNDESHADFPLVREHFDLIGFDPRGVPHGIGDQVLCPQQSVPDPHIPLIPNTSAQYLARQKYNRAFAMACLRKTGPLVKHIDTQSVVKDMDAIRQALREKTISYFGISYGTELGEFYAQKYPQHLRAIVLDGNKGDVSDSLLSLVQWEAHDKEAALKYINDRCHNESTCTVPGKNIIKSFTTLLDKATHKQLRGIHGYSITPEDLEGKMFNDLYGAQDINFAELSAWLTQSQKFFQSESESTDPGYYGTFNKEVICLESPTNFSFQQYKLLIDQAKILEPDLYQTGGSLAIPSCTGWPFKTHNQSPPLHISPRLPVLLVSNQIDPATPLGNALDLHHKIADSRLIITNAVGHTADDYSHCGRVAIAQYLLTAKLPTHDEHCSG